MVFGFQKRRRKRLAATPLSAEQLAVLRRNVPYYELLPVEARYKLQGLIQIFLAEKRFEGCGGLEITDEIRITIAALACILVLGHDTDFYPKLRSIIVYPHAYVDNTPDPQPDGTVYEEPEDRLGESWEEGYVVLSWDDVLRGAADISDGENIVWHEFAHQLDSESGTTEGDPVLPERSMYETWARVFRREFEALIESVERGRPSFFDPYGVTSPADFFAVVTECFFERPRVLRVRHPELYELMKLYFRQDPAGFEG